MFSISGIKKCRDVALVLVMALFGAAQADGPVSVAALPGGGGNVVTDTDITEGGGLGQRWGRVGGRTVTYHVADPSTFSALTFGVVQGTAPSLAFDGAVTNATGEIMSYNPGQSNLAQGMARWTGFANLPLFNGGVNNLPTRFTITVTRTNGTAVPLGVDTLASVLATGDFRVNLLFEMQDLSNSSIFQPVLDYYDSLATPVGLPPASNTGPVMTGVNTGFYFTVADTGMTIEEHDAHLQALFDGINPKINNINDKINFLRTDWDGRMPTIQNQVGDVYNSLNNSIAPTLSQIQQQVGQLLGNTSNAGLATKQDTDAIFGRTDSINQILMLIMGFGCPQGAPPGFCASFKNLPQQGVDITNILIGLNLANTKLDGVATQTSVQGILIGLNNANTAISGLQAKIDELQDAIDSMASQSLEVQAIQVDSGDPKKFRWLVKTTRDGVMVNASLTRLATVRGSTLANVSPTVVTLGTGLHDVTLGVTKDTEGIAYLFEASMAVAGGSPIQGSALLITEKKGASPF